MRWLTAVWGRYFALQMSKSLFRFMLLERLCLRGGSMILLSRGLFWSRSPH